jgi:hypothetical protein
MLAVDETGDAKSSTDAVGAAQQYSGALGGVGLCQVAVHLSLATQRTVGLDQGQVRTWTSWHRWSTAALTAYAFLVIAALLEHHAATDDPTELVPLSCPELQHLLTAAVLPAPRGDRDHIHHWSLWRRRHQASARACHRAWNAYADRVA